MATFSVTGNMTFTRSIESLSRMPDSVVISMAKAMGEKVAEAERNYARANLNIKGYSKGAVAAGVNVRPPTKKAGGATVMINFVGTQHGRRIGEIAFINEYGKKSMPARNWIKQSNASVEDAAVKAAEDVLDNYLASNGF